jgi:hypothetical protein
VMPPLRSSTTSPRASMSLRPSLTTRAKPPHGTLTRRCAPWPTPIGRARWSPGVSMRSSPLRRAQRAGARHSLASGEAGRRGRSGARRRGEAAPTLTRDPRVPRLGAIAEVGS